MAAMNYSMFLIHNMLKDILIFRTIKFSIQKCLVWHTALGIDFLMAMLACCLEERFFAGAPMVCVATGAPLDRVLIKYYRIYRLRTNPGYKI